MFVSGREFAKGWKAKLNRRSLERWLEAYKQAWQEGDPAQIGPLFSEDATYAETPFGDSIRGRAGIIEYWTGGAQDTQTNVSFGYGILAVEGDTGFAHWWAEFDRVPSGKHVELDGYSC